MKIRVFEWDLKNSNHVKKHGVDPEEVEEVLITNNYLRKTRQGRYIAYGSTLVGRLLTVVFIYKGNKIWIIRRRELIEKKGDDFMNKNLKKIPKFNSEDEEAEFWSTHSTVDYWDDMEEVEEEIELDEELKNKIIERGMKKMPLTLHLELRLITAAKRIAQRKNIGYKALLCKWIEEGIKTELSTTPH